MSQAALDIRFMSADLSGLARLCSQVSRELSISATTFLQEGKSGGRVSVQRAASAEGENRNLRTSDEIAGGEAHSLAHLLSQSADIQ